MVNFCKDHSSDTFIILTESGMMHRLVRLLLLVELEIAPAMFVAS